MRNVARVLLNTPDIEVWPGGLLRARSNHDARILSRATRVLRRKRDGRYLAAELPEGLMPLVQRLMREYGIEEALDALEAFAPHERAGLERVHELPLARLREHLDILGIDDDYAERTGLPLVAEPDRLDFAGFDRFRRPLWLLPGAAPGYSEHHGGRALDIGTPDEPPAEESFEKTAAFEWLQRNAEGHGFVLSYPRDNPHGIVYEPWHWCWRG